MRGARAGRRLNPVVRRSGRAVARRAVCRLVVEDLRPAAAARPVDGAGDAACDGVLADHDRPGVDSGDRGRRNRVRGGVVVHPCLDVDGGERVDPGEGGGADDPLGVAAQHPAVARRLAADRPDAVPVGVELVRGVVVVEGEQRPGGGDGGDRAAGAEAVGKGDDDDVVLADAGGAVDGDGVGVGSGGGGLGGGVVGDRGIDHVRERELGVVEREREDRPAAAALQRPACSLRRHVAAVRVEDRRAGDVQGCDDRPVQEGDGAVVADPGAEPGLELPAPDASAMTTVDRQEVLGVRGTDGDRLAAERARSADAAVIALPVLGGVEERLETKQTVAAGDGDTGALEADADVLGGAADEWCGGIGRAESLGEEGGFSVRASEQCGACEDAAGRGERGDETEHYGQPQLPRECRAMPWLPQSVVLRHLNPAFADRSRAAETPCRCLFNRPAGEPT